MGPYLARGRKPILRHAVDGLEASRRAERRGRDRVPRPSERKRRPRSCVGSKIGRRLPFTLNGAYLDIKEIYGILKEQENSEYFKSLKPERALDLDHPMLFFSLNSI